MEARTRDKDRCPTKVPRLSLSVDDRLNPISELWPYARIRTMSWEELKAGRIPDWTIIQLDTTFVSTLDHRNGAELTKIGYQNHELFSVHPGLE